MICVRLGLLVVAVFAISMGEASWARAEVAISTQLGRDLTQAIMNEGLWDPAFDQYGNADGRDLSWFWNELGPAGRQPMPEVIEQLFGYRDPSRAASIRLPKLYPIKIIILRYLRERSPTSRILQVQEAWMRQYLETALATIEEARLEDMRPILTAFREKLRTGQIKVRDLSPSERETLSQLIPSDHGVDMMARDERGRFRVSGVYQEERKYFALDFAREVEDTIITFAHEIVHAADPQLATYRQDYLNLFGPVQKILIRWLDGASGKKSDRIEEIRELGIDIVDHLFFEVNIAQFKEMADSIRARRMKQIKDDLAAQKGKEDAIEPTDEETKLIRRWIRAAIGLSVENEYRAYGLSVVVYGLLKDKFGILRPSAEREGYIRKLLAGDAVLASEMAVRADPFLRAKSRLFPRFMSPKQRDKEMDPETKALLLRINRVLSFLEFTFLDETERFEKSLNDRMSLALRQISLDGLKSESILPEWARPGGFDLPTHPHYFFTARMTTASVIRFTQNVELFLSEIQATNLPLATLRLGVLDMSDVSLGERKLIGVTYEDSPWTQQPDQIPGPLKQDLSSVPQEISRYFELTKWRPDAYASGESLISGKQVAQNLVKLRTLKASVWLDEAFPQFKMQILGIRAFLQRLRENLYSKEEIPEQRAKEFEAELVDTFGKAEISSGELVRLRQLLSQVSWMYEVAQESKWTGMASLLNSKIQFVVQALDALGVVARQTSVTLEEEDRQSVRFFERQLQKPIGDCKSTKPNPYGLSGFWQLKGPFKVRETDEKGFSLIAFCYMQQLYLVRQPGDYLPYMSTMIEKDPRTGVSAPGARVFTGGRGIHLFPYVPPKEESKESGPRRKFLGLF